MESLSAFAAELPAQIFLGIVINGLTAALTWTGMRAVRKAKATGEQAVAGWGSVRQFFGDTGRSAFSVISYNPFAAASRALVWALFVIGMAAKYLGTIIVLYIGFSVWFGSMENTTALATWVLPGLIVGIALAFATGREAIGAIGNIIALMVLLYLCCVLTLNFAYWLELPLTLLASPFFEFPVGAAVEFWTGGTLAVLDRSLLFILAPADAFGLLFRAAPYGLAPLAIWACMIGAFCFALWVTIKAYWNVYYNTQPFREQRAARRRTTGMAASV